MFGALASAYAEYAPLYSPARRAVVSQFELSFLR